MELHDTLKSTLVGGYDRESVLQYIELLIETNQGEVNKLSGELSKLRALNNSLAEQNQRLHTQYHELADSMQKLGYNIKTLLTENKQLATQVEHYKGRETAVMSLREEMEDVANDLIQEAQAQAWLIEVESRRTIVETEKRVAVLLDDAEAAREHMMHLAVVQRAEASAELERELWNLLTLARRVGQIGKEVEDMLPVRALDENA